MTSTTDEMVRYKAQDGTEVALNREIMSRDVLGIRDGQVSDRELNAAIAKCAARGLNPWAGDAYLTPRGDSITITVSKDYYVRTACAQPTYDGAKAGVIALDEQGRAIYHEGSFYAPGEKLVGGWAEVHDKRRSVPCRDEVLLSEYSTGKALWASKPATMIRKVALVHALRESYPDAFQGLYDEAEMGDVQPAKAPEPIEPDVVEAAVDLNPIRERMSDYTAALHGDLDRKAGMQASTADILAYVGKESMDELDSCDVERVCDYMDDATEAVQYMEEAF